MVFYFSSPWHEDLAHVACMWQISSPCNSTVYTGEFARPCFTSPRPIWRILRGPKLKPYKNEFPWNCLQLKDTRMETMAGAVIFILHSTLSRMDVIRLYLWHKSFNYTHLYSFGRSDKVGSSLPPRSSQLFVERMKKSTSSSGPHNHWWYDVTTSSIGHNLHWILRVVCSWFQGPSFVKCRKRYRNWKNSKEIHCSFYAPDRKESERPTKIVHSVSGKTM